MYLLAEGRFAFGIVVGVSIAVITSLTVNFADLELLQDRAILGAIIGGVLAGGASLVATVLMMVNASAEAKRRTESSDRAMSVSILTRLMAISDQATKSKRHFFCIEASSVVYLEDRNPIWKPLENFSKPIKFTQDELAYVVAEFGPGYLTRIIDIEGVSENIVWLNNKYREDFNTWFEALKDQPNITISGSQVSGNLSVRLTDLLMFDNVSEQLLDLVWTAGPEAELLIHEIVQHCNEKFGMTLGFFVDPKGSGSS